MAAADDDRSDGGIVGNNRAPHAAGRPELLVGVFIGAVAHGGPALELAWARVFVEPGGRGAVGALLVGCRGSRAGDPGAARTARGAILVADVQAVVEPAARSGVQLPVGGAF